MNSDDAKQHLLAHARLQAKNAGDTLLAAAQAERLRLKRAGWEDDREIEDALRIHLAELSKGWLDRVADQAVNIGFSLGRVTAAEDSRDEISYATYSALLDASCCKPCEANDGKVVSLDSTEYEELLPPFTGCEGKDSCRCVMLFVVEGAPKE